MTKLLRIQRVDVRDPEYLRANQWTRVEHLAGTGRDGAVFKCPRCRGLVVLGRLHRIGPDGLVLPRIQHRPGSCGFVAAVILDQWDGVSFIDEPQAPAITPTEPLMEDEDLD